MSRCAFLSLQALVIRIDELVSPSRLIRLLSPVKPENLIFANKTEDADLLIADFGLSRIIQEDTFKMLTTTCGTPGSFQLTISFVALEVVRRLTLLPSFSL